MNDSSIEERVKYFMEYAASVERETGQSLHVVGATKTRTVDEINRAIAAGLSIVGENRAQEFRDKHELISPAAAQHFIGHLQANKLKYVVGKASLIHSCDSREIALSINEYAARLGVVQDVLLEVNIGGEESKHGFTFDGALSSAESLKTLKNLRFRGVMTVLPKLDQSYLAPLCNKTKELFGRLRPIFGEEFIYLSMGMSGDYELAVRCGANMIRLGSAIFGARDYGENNGKD